MGVNELQLLLQESTVYLQIIFLGDRRNFHKSLQLSRVVNKDG